MNRPAPPHHRICLLFDLDCFYAQCERVRLGLPEDVCLALLQWDAVLAVTYPARKFGIKRGDGWEAVAQKSKNACWAIHLQILEKEKVRPPQQELPTTMIRNPKNPYVKPTIPDQPSSSTERASSHHHIPQNVDNQDGEGEPIVANIKDAFDQIYKLTREEQIDRQKRERGVRRFYNEGKACLERYRIASMRIFSVVLESLTNHLGGKDNFVLERASIDEFYLDITDYCYELSKLTMSDMDHQTCMVGGEKAPPNAELDCYLQTLALQRACQISHWVRKDVFDTLGFTMSAGICTNKMMSKLAASYGKPNGQAVLFLSNFQSLLNDIKIKSARHFGGKLGSQVLSILREQSSQPESFDRYAATMGDLQQIPLPLLQKHFSDETASFIFGACRGVDNEPVRKTNGALVKSITAFKSFPPTSHVEDIHNWISLMANEVVDRVTKDSVRNHRYPKTCTLNYTYYTTDTGKRPAGVASARSFCSIKSIRLSFPQENSSHRKADLVVQSMEKLSPILKQQSLRGVGLSVSNFESRRGPPEGVQGITTFFKKADTTGGTTNQKALNRSTNGSVMFSKKKRKTEIGSYFHPQAQLEDEDAETPYDTDIGEPPRKSKNSATEDHGRPPPTTGVPTLDSPGKVLASSQSLSCVMNNRPSQCKDQFVIDQELALKLQATFDRENYVLNTTDRRFSNSKKPTPKKARTIDSFFGKKA